MIAQALETLFNSWANCSIDSLRRATLSFVVMSFSGSGDGCLHNTILNPFPERQGHTHPSACVAQLSEDYRLTSHRMS